MPIGPGKYDQICTDAREQAEAEAVILIVVKGNKGSGFSVQATSLEILATLPDMLEIIVKEMRQSTRSHPG